MQENYLIHILGRQEIDGEKDEIKLDTVGAYCQRDGHQYISYRDYYDELDPKNYRTTVLKLEGPQKATLLHAGSATRLILEEGKRHYCQYDTGYGTLTIGTFAQKIENNLHSQGGSLRIHYTLDMNAGFLSFHEISVTIKPMK